MFRAFFLTVLSVKKNLSNPLKNTYKLLCKKA